jgi:hypothetical protein
MAWRSLAVPALEEVTKPACRHANPCGAVWPSSCDCVFLAAAWYPTAAASARPARGRALRESQGITSGTRSRGRRATRHRMDPSSSPALRKRGSRCGLARLERSSAYRAIRHGPLPCEAVKKIWGHACRAAEVMDSLQPARSVPELFHNFLRIAARCWGPFGASAPRQPVDSAR